MKRIDTKYGKMLVDEDKVLGRGLIKPIGKCIKEIKFDTEYLIKALYIIRDNLPDRLTLYIYDEKCAPIIIGERQNDDKIDGVIVAPVVEDE